GLGMATKEVMVTAPVMVWLWRRTFATAGPGRLALGPSHSGARAQGPRPKAWLVAGLCSTWLILFALQLSHPRGATVGFANGWTPWTSLLTQSAVIAHYLKLAIVPAPLAFSYAWPMATSIADVALPFVLVALLVTATIIGVVRRQPLAFLGAWVFLI